MKIKLTKKNKQKKESRASFCFKPELCFIWTSGFNKTSTEHSECRPLCRRDNVQASPVLRYIWWCWEAGVSLLEGVREVTKWLPWSVRCPLRSIRKRWSPSQHIPLCKSSSPREEGVCVCVCVWRNQTW